MGPEDYSELFITEKKSLYVADYESLPKLQT